MMKMTDYDFLQTLFELEEIADPRGEGRKTQQSAARKYGGISAFIWPGGNRKSYEEGRQIRYSVNLISSMRVLGWRKSQELGKGKRMRQSHRLVSSTHNLAWRNCTTLDKRYKA
jgi:hypothetical protein